MATNNGVRTAARPKIMLNLNRKKAAPAPKMPTNDPVTGQDAAIQSNEHSLPSPLSSPPTTNAMLQPYTNKLMAVKVETSTSTEQRLEDVAEHKHDIMSNEMAFTRQERSVSVLVYTDDDVDELFRINNARLHQGLGPLPAPTQQRQSSTNIRITPRRAEQHRQAALARNRMTAFTVDYEYSTDDGAGAVVYKTAMFLRRPNYVRLMTQLRRKHSEHVHDIKGGALKAEAKMRVAFADGSRITFSSARWSKLLEELMKTTQKPTEKRARIVVESVVTQA